MRITRDFSCGLTFLTLISQLPLSSIALLRFLGGGATMRLRMVARPRAALARIVSAIEATARAGVPPQPRSVSIGKVASRAHSPIEPS